MRRSTRICVIDHEGMVGAALVQHLVRQGVTPEQLITPSAQTLDLTDVSAVTAMMLHEQPDQVYLPVPRCHAVETGEAMLEHLQTLTLVIAAAWRARVPRLVFIGSAHVYPFQAMSPMNEEDLLTGLPDPSDEHLALPQIAAIRLCQRLSQQHPACDYRSLIVAAPFGPGDVYESGSGTVARLLERLHQAKVQDEPWIRLGALASDTHEFLYVQDIAAAAWYSMNLDRSVYRASLSHGIGHLNAGYGRPCSLGALAASIAGVVGYRGRIEHISPAEERSRHVLDSHRLRSTGWRPALDMEDALALTYYDFLTSRRASYQLHG